VGLKGSISIFVTSIILPNLGFKRPICRSHSQPNQSNSAVTRALLALRPHIRHQQQRTVSTGKRQLQMAALAVFCPKLQSLLKTNWSRGQWVKCPLIIRTNNTDWTLICCQRRYSDDGHLTVISPGRGQAKHQGEHDSPKFITYQSFWWLMSIKPCIYKG